MIRSIRSILPVAGLLVSAAVVEAQTVTAYALSTHSTGVQQLVRFNPNAPGTVTTVGGTGVNLTDIDFRPLTNTLYGYDGDRLYTVDLNTGVATLAFDVNNTTGMSGVDFNPVADRFRVTDFIGNTYRINQLTGATTVDGAYMFAMGDVNFGRTPRLTSVAYTNSDNDPATGTTLYAIDPTLGQLILVGNPNGGAINTVGTGLGIGSIASVTGFDIFSSSNMAYFSAILTGSMTNNFYSLNLNSGVATLIGGIPGNRVTGLALTNVPEPGTWALMVTGLIGLGGIARRRAKKA
ncbi:MAG TPA: DUF4394 domain-containing protein [Gemmatimonadaceae bacterium]|nr:DUF4394 domain-containing protein [Gemmatimonadaceae bacterium]